MNDDLENRLRATFTAVREATPVPPAPSTLPVVAAKRSKARRAGVVAGIVLSASGIGLGVAAATGGLPGGFWGEPSPGAFNALPETGHLAVTNTDSVGEPIQLWLSRALGDRDDPTLPPEDGYCVAFVLPNRPDPQHLVGGGCSGDIGTKFWAMFGSSGIAAGNYFARHVPGAASVILRQPDGSMKTLAVGDGWTVGRQDSGVPGESELVGYDSAGREVGRVSLPDLPDE